ncbi:hypothetical protein [Halocynthiibacter styelae]|uniref:Uncharacterized protein n=1 Tax=Halocynthiibacter styelae TaxID=2761955 RepID=A0A8J7LPL7_9RHOB|nr:hypothetical protein [Paenihalocynthiibacter styelae]MBI1492992.1 hypothetical protein [Paenihalocynthiibacter styelae]
MKKWILRGLGLYALVLLGNLVFAFAGAGYISIGNFDNQFSKPSVVVWFSEIGWIHGQDLQIDGRPFDRGQRMSDQRPNLAQADILAIFVDGFEQINQVQFAEELGLSDSELQMKPAVTGIKRESAAVSVRPHILPFYAAHEVLIVRDISELGRRYRSECATELLLMWTLLEEDEDLLASCELPEDEQS